jgi:hypothetical protein
MIDTLKASIRLREAGFDEEKAGAIVSAFAEDMGEQLSTRGDIERLEERIDASGRRLEERVDAGEERLEQRLTIRMGVVATTATGVILAAVGIATGIIASL